LAADGFGAAKVDEGKKVKNKEDYKVKVGRE
jgi:hypothetical protein